MLTPFITYSTAFSESDWLVLDVSNNPLKLEIELLLQDPSMYLIQDTTQLPHTGRNERGKCSKASKAANI